MLSQPRFFWFRAVRISILFICPFYGFTGTVPNETDLFRFAIYWHEENSLGNGEDYFPADLLCLLGGECKRCECDEPVTFADSAFEGFVRTALNIPQGPICKCDMATRSSI